MSTSTSDIVLTSFQEAYILERHKYGSNSACAKAIGVHSNTISNWRRTSPDFALAEKRMGEATAVAIANPDNYIHDELRPLAMQRMHEIISESITPGTDNSRLNYIRQASEQILKGTGDLRPDGTGSANFVQIINDFRTNGGEYVPSWNKQDLDPGVVDIDFTEYGYVPGSSSVPTEPPA